MDYEKLYKVAFERANIIYTGKYKPEIAAWTKETLEAIFPELKENEDERIRKVLIDYFNNANKSDENPLYEYGICTDKVIIWLKKQGESDKSLYIRFGDIPTNGKSKVYNGEIEIGIEEGISVYPAFEGKEGNIILGLNLPVTKTSLHTQQHLLEYDNRPCYLVTGDYVGKGTDGEPLIKNVRIIKEIKPYRVKEDKENNTYVINNTPNCGISVYNESENERIRKELIGLLDDLWAGKDNIMTTREEYETYLAWLEKQKEQKPADNVKPKFKIGDIIKFKGNETLEGEAETHKIISYDNELYVFADGTTDLFCEQDLYELVEQKPTDDVVPKFHEGEWWDITKDAKDGDVLDANGAPFIYKKHDKDYVYFYCGVNLAGDFIEANNIDTWNNNSKVYPATKEQRDLLFQKMKEAGYEWDEDKKELRKMEQKPKWTEEDDLRANQAIYVLHQHGYVDLCAWVNSLKQRMEGKV